MNNSKANVNIIRRKYIGFFAVKFLAFASFDSQVIDRKD